MLILIIAILAVILVLAVAETIRQSNTPVIYIRPHEVGWNKLTIKEKIEHAKAYGIDYTPEQLAAEEEAAEHRNFEEV